MKRDRVEQILKETKMKTKKTTPNTWTMWAITWECYNDEIAPDVHKYGPWMICCTKPMAERYILPKSHQKVQRVRVQFVKPKRKHE